MKVRVDRRWNIVRQSVTAVVVAGLVGICGILAKEFGRISRLRLSGREYRFSAALARECPGWLVFQRESLELPEGVYVARVGGRIAVRIADGRYPRWSPDGRNIAFFDGSNICLVSAEGRAKRTLATTEDPRPRALAFHPSGTEVWFTDGDRLRVVGLADRRTRTVLSNIAVRGLAFSGDGRRLVVSVAGHKMYAMELREGTFVQPARYLGRGCSAAVSPGGEFYSDLDGRHVCVRLRRWSDDSVVTQLDGPEGWPVDNESWSNVQRWVVARTERPGPVDIWVWDLVTGRAVRMTGTQDTNRPHLWVADSSSSAASSWLKWWWRRWVWRS